MNAITTSRRPRKPRHPCRSRIRSAIDAAIPGGSDGFAVEGLPGESNSAAKSSVLRSNKRNAAKYLSPVPIAAGIRLLQGSSPQGFGSYKVHRRRDSAPARFIAEGIRLLQWSGRGRAGANVCGDKTTVIRLQPIANRPDSG